MKLTNKSGSRKYQRDQTNKLIDSTKDMTILSAEPPSNLEGLAAIAWENLVPMLNEAGFVKAIDASSVELLCMTIEMYKLAYESVKVDGIQTAIYKTSLSPVTGEIASRDFSGFKRNPATQIIDSATAKIKTLSDVLGLSPASRANLLEAVGTDTEEQSLADLLNGDGVMVQGLSDENDASMQAFFNQKDAVNTLHVHGFDPIFGFQNWVKYLQSANSSLGDD